MTNSLLISPLLLEEQCLDVVATEELEYISRFSSASRRKESLTWRAVVGRALGRKIRVVYDENGAPSIVGSNLYIGVSHTKDMVAVTLSTKPCAVDIERKDRSFSRAAAKFLTEEEQKLAVSNTALAAIWCAKECYYKFSRNPQLDMLKGIRVVELDLEQGRVTVEDNQSEKATMKILDRDDHIIVYIL